MRKILAAIFMLCFAMNVNAKTIKGDFNTIITDSGIDKNSISISIKELDTNKVIYKQNDQILMHPASIQKILTLPSAVEILGEDYNFNTSMYSRGENAYLIKLGADPYLTSKDLANFVKNINNKTVKQIYIDSSIIEPKDWGEGWQWDDDLNTYMPRFNSYNLDNNLIKITVMKSNDGKSSIVINPSKYPLAFFNNVVVGEKTKVKLIRDNMISPNALTIEGTVNKPVTLYIPTNNLKKYFDEKFTQAMADRNIYLKTYITQSNQIADDRLIIKIVHPLSQAINDILKNSNNMVAETVQKLAAAKFYNKTGTDFEGIKIFEQYCKNLGLDTSRIRVVDASGVSKNNLLSTDFMTEYLIKNKNNKTLQFMAKPGEGTLTNRMMLLNSNLSAKTGTLSDISSIAGYLEAKSGKKYAFCIITNDPASSDSDKKTLEDYIIKELYIKG